MKIYVAAPWVHKEDADKTAELLRAAGFEVISGWHKTRYDTNVYEAPDSVMEKEAWNDWVDINNADTIVYLNLAKSEGKASELGIALARGYTIYVVGGKQNNIFLHLPMINHKESLDEVIECLR